MAELKIISMDEVPVEEVEWLWYPYIPYGKLTIIHGDGGEGKTTLILRLAALLSRGEKLPCDDTEREPIKVIYQTAEDGLGDSRNEKERIQRKQFLSERGLQEAVPRKPRFFQQVHNNRDAHD